MGGQNPSALARIAPASSHRLFLPDITFIENDAVNSRQLGLTALELGNTRGYGGLRDKE